MTAAPVVSDRATAKLRRRPALILGLVMIAAVAAGYLAWQHFEQSPRAAPEPPPPVPVIAATVKQQNFPIVLTGIGNVAALNTATIRSMVTEQIVSIDFKDGQYVKKGQLLAQLDPSTYQAQLDQAEANLTRDEAHLENGRINLGRYVPLEKKGLQPRSRSPRSKRRSLKKRPLSKPIRRRSNMPRRSSIIQNWSRRSTESPEFVCSMSATSFTRARHGDPRPSQMLWS